MTPGELKAIIEENKKLKEKIKTLVEMEFYNKLIAENKKLREEIEITKLALNRALGFE